MWLRITLVFRNGQGWELMEFSEPISELDDLEAEIYDPESILEVLTLAHVHCVPSEDLGFRLVEGGQPTVFDDDVMDDTEDPVVEAPADIPEAKPLEEGRQVPYQDESSVTVEGVVFTAQSSRAACTSLGLSTPGSTHDCMKRMIEHVKTQDMIAAQSVEAKLKRDIERHAVPQSKPRAPSEQVREAHNLTHEPYEPWCSCTMCCTQSTSRLSQNAKA
jgi:hypothetical protein